MQQAQEADKSDNFESKRGSWHEDQDRLSISKAQHKRSPGSPDNDIESMRASSNLELDTHGDQDNGTVSSRTPIRTFDAHKNGDQEQEQEVHPRRNLQEARQSLSYYPRSREFIRNDLRSMAFELRIDTGLVHAQEAIAAGLFELAESKASSSLSLAQKEFKDFEPLHARCHFYIGVAIFNMGRTASALSELRGSRPIKGIYSEGTRVESLIDDCKAELFRRSAASADQTRRNPGPQRRSVIKTSELAIRNLNNRLGKLINPDFPREEHVQALLRLSGLSEEAQQRSSLQTTTNSDLKEILNAHRNQHTENDYISPHMPSGGVTQVLGDFGSEQYGVPSQWNRSGSTSSGDHIVRENHSVGFSPVLGLSLGEELSNLDEEDYED